MRILLAIAFLALILVQVIFTKTFQALLSLVNNLIWIQTLHSWELHNLSPIIVQFINIDSFVLVITIAANHVEERVLCQAIVHNLRLVLLLKVDSATLSLKCTLSALITTGSCRIHLPELFLKAELFINLRGSRRLMPLISILIVSPLASLVFSLLCLGQFGLIMLRKYLECRNRVFLLLRNDLRLIMLHFVLLL